MLNNKEFTEAFNRLEAVTEELGRIRRALEAVKDGIPFEEAFNEEIYLEAVDRSKCKNLSAEIVCHLLEMRYSSNKMLYKHWEKEVIEFREQICREIDWDLHLKRMAKKKGYAHDSNAVSFMRFNLQEYYEIGITYYEKLVRNKKYPDLPPIDGIIPEECPWALEEFLDGDIDEIISKLPKEGEP